MGGDLVLAGIPEAYGSVWVNVWMDSWTVCYLLCF